MKEDKLHIATIKLSKNIFITQNQRKYADINVLQIWQSLTQYQAWINFYQPQKAQRFTPLLSWAWFMLCTNKKYTPTPSTPLCKKKMCVCGGVALSQGHPRQRPDMHPDIHLSQPLRAREQVGQLESPGSHPPSPKCNQSIV